MVKLLTASNFCVGNSFFVCSSIRFRIAFTVKRCVSAQKPCIVGRWVWVCGHGLLVGEWVVTGCVFLPLFLGSLSLLSDARQRTNLEWWAAGYRSVGVHWWVSGLLGAAFYYYHHHPPTTFLGKRCASANKPCMAGEHHGANKCVPRR